MQKAQLSWHLFIDCNCGETIDLADLDAEGDYCFSKILFREGWDKIKDEEVICPKCSNPIVIEGIEY